MIDRSPLRPGGDPEHTPYSKLAQLTMFRRQPLLAMDMNETLVDEDSHAERQSGTEKLRGPCGSMLVRMYPPDEASFVQ